MASRIYSIESKVNAKQCFLCSGFTEYYCQPCQKGLCEHCKAVHVIDPVTKRHKVTIYREKFKNIHKRDIFKIGNRGIVCNKYCETCEVPVCSSWSDKNSIESPIFASIIPKKHKKHKLVAIGKAYQAKRQQYKTLIHDIRSETINNERVLLKRLKSNVDTNVQTCQRIISQCRSELKNRCQMRLKYLIDSVKDNVMIRIRFKTSCLLQKKRQAQHIRRIQKYEHGFEQSASRPVKFLRFVKRARPPQISDTPHLIQHKLLNLTREINMKDLIKLLTGEALYNGLVLLKRLKSNVDTCQREISRCHSEIKNRYERLKDHHKSVKDNAFISVILQYNGPLPTNIQDHYFGVLKEFERRFYESADRPVTFVRSVKTICLPQKSDTPDLTQHYPLNLTRKKRKTQKPDRTESSANPDAGPRVTEFCSSVRY